MSDEPPTPKGQNQELAPTPDFDVGYRKPPSEHRFIKGKSGNPKGRPKRAGNVVPTSRSLAFGSQPANALLIQEAYRVVTLREGERVIELPAIQAVFRAMGVSAMKGNRFAQRTIAELVQQVENDDREMHSSYIKTMIDYKSDWEQAIDEAKARGWPIPKPLPHPDDIIIDFKNPNAYIAGPLTKEDKVNWDKQLKRRDDAQTEVSYYAKAWRLARNTETKALLLMEWHGEQRIFDIINDNLPQHYRVELKDRSWTADASLPGSQKRVEWP